MILKENNITLEYPMLQKDQIILFKQIQKIYIFNQSHAKKQIPYNKIVIVLQKDQSLKLHVKFQKFGQKKKNKEIRNYLIEIQKTIHHIYQIKFNNQ